VARALEAVHTGDLDAVAAQVAVHYERANQPKEAIEYYRRAAEIAQGMQSEEDATRYRQRVSALEEQLATDIP
jgi:hypothetical protein